MAYPPLPAIQNLPAAEIRNLAITADAAFSSAISQTWGSVGPRAGEVDLVLGCFVHGLPLLEKLWNQVLQPHGASVVVSGIFIHATPRVIPTYRDPNDEVQAETIFPTTREACELGDLLVVVLPVSYPGGMGNSAIFQAKRGFPSGDSPLQRRLYEWASDFTYRSPGALEGESRCILNKTLSHLSYWDLGTTNRPSSGECIIPTDSRNQVNSRQTFGEALTGLMTGGFGKGFEALNPAQSSWSRIMHDLFSVTARTVVNKGSSNIRGMKRGPDSNHQIWTQIAANGPAVVRNSLGKVFAHFGQELADLGKEIEASSKPMGRSESRDQISKEPPPPEIPYLDSIERPPDPNGMSTIFIHVKA